MPDKLLLRSSKIGKYLKYIPDYFLLRSSDLFDGTWYLEHNPDVALAGGNPVWHYLTYGGSEGRDPSPRFCSRWYLDTYKDVKEAGINPLVHYLKRGRKEGRAAMPPPSLTTDEDEHRSLIRSSGFFDDESYLANNPDVAQAGIDPLFHYLHYGGFEGRDLPPHFYSQWYLDTYEDVGKSGINPLVHYLKYGQKEGRRKEPPVFELRRMYDHSKQTNRIVFEDAPERIYMRRPKVIGSFSGTLNEGEAECPRPYVSVIEDAVIVGGENLVMIREGIVLNDELADFNSAEFGKKSTRIKTVQDGKVMFRDNKKPGAHIEEGILLSCGHDNNYFHWLVECLPKLLLIDSLEGFKDVPLLIPAGLHNNLMAALERLNVNNRPLLFIEPEPACHVKRLIYPSPLSRILDRYEGAPAFNTDIVLSHKWISMVANLLKNHRNNNGKTWRKLFLARRKGLRSLKNQEQLEQLLLDHNFEIADLDGVSLNAQIKLFSQASLIVAPTGAALTNMLFCQPGTKVIIFMSNHETTNFYFWSNLGAINNLDVTTIAGERVFNLTDYWSVHDDYVVDTWLVLNEIKRQERI
jgi:capsular polysaccharide biosynthesis protein